MAFSGGKVAKVGNDLTGAAETRDVKGYIVSPGLIDLHTHVYWGGTSLGIDAEDFCRTSGVTTAIDTGSAGPGNFAGFRKHVIERSEVRILAYLHVSFAGIYRVLQDRDGRRERGDAADGADRGRAGRGRQPRRDHRHQGAGRARLERHPGAAPLDIALQAANEVGMPLMCHIDFPPPSYEEVVQKLRPGDVLTHAFRPFPNAPYDHQGKVKDVVLDARARGVKFDIGHGKGSFAFKTARAMLANGFYPDTISSDVHTLCIEGPAFDQVTTLSKFLCMGMPLSDVIAASTVNAAMALKRPELGSFKPGCAGDATILTVKDGQFDYVDVVGEHMTGDKRILSEGVVINGRWWHPNDSAKFKKMESAA